MGFLNFPYEVNKQLLNLINDLSIEQFEAEQRLAKLKKLFPYLPVDLEKTNRKKLFADPRGKLPSHIQASMAASPDLTEFILNMKYKDGGNIREAPTLSAPRLYKIANGEIMHFLNEEQVDSKGIKWLKIQTANGIVRLKPP